MTHALAQFVQAEAQRRGWTNQDLANAAGMTKQNAWRYLHDTRESVKKLPERSTLEGLAKAYRVPFGYLASLAVESLDVGFTAGDFISSVRDASDDELLEVLADRLRSARNSREDGDDGGDAAPSKMPAPGPADQPGLRIVDPERLVADGEDGDIEGDQDKGQT